MRKITVLSYLLALLPIVPAAVQAQTASCCSRPAATAAFASLGQDPGFVASHQNPRPFIYQGAAGQMITFPGMDDREARAYLLKAAQPTDQYLFVFHEWWGLNDYIRQEVARLSKDLGNVNVMALDLYDGKVAATKEEATAMVQAVDSKRAVAIIEGAIRHVGPQARIAMLGWCFGGGWALQAALHADQQAVGCVMYYGQPEENVERLSDLDCDVLAFFGTKDKWLNAEVAKRFEQNMKKAGKLVTVKLYNADHAFANPSNPVYDKVAAQDAYKVALAYLKKKFAS